jgi:hypothetical protein
MSVKNISYISLLFRQNLGMNYRIFYGGGKILQTHICNKIASKYVFISFNIKFTDTISSHSRKMILVINPSSMLLAVGNTRFKIKKFYVLPIVALIFYYSQSSDYFSVKY